MTVQALVDGRLREFTGTADVMALIDQRARERHPERYAPDGQPLTFERGATWAERREAWRRRTVEVDPEPLDDEPEGTP